MISTERFPALPGLGSRKISLLILAAAMVFGGYQRFHHVGKYELTSDEAASWAAASAPTAREVVARGVELNPGKFAIHDLLLHFWMLPFGDSVTSMRSLSASLGTIAIPLVFLVALELFDAGPEREGFIPGEEARGVAALTATIFALNLVAIKLSREVRMYPLLMVAALGQVWCFLRAVRRGGVANYTFAALFGVAAVMGNFSAMLIFWAEGLWALHVMWRRGEWPARLAPHARPFAIGLAAAALAVSGLALPELVRWRAQAGAWEQGWLGWFAPGTANVLEAFRRPAFGQWIIRLTAPLAGWGIIRGWSRAPETVSFAVLWMFVPVLILSLLVRTPLAMLTVVAYGWTPVYPSRYIVTCFVPLCFLIAFGIWELRSDSARIATLALVWALALGPIHAYRPTLDEAGWGTQWREAVELVAPDLKKGRAVNVRTSPNAARYYLRNDPEVNPALLQRDDPHAEILILSEQAANRLDSSETAALRQAYPHLVARLERVQVWRR